MWEVDASEIYELSLDQIQTLEQATYQDDKELPPEILPDWYYEADIQRLAIATHGLKGWQDRFVSFLECVFLVELICFL